MPLSDMKIRSAKPEIKTVKLSDGEGLQLWISPAGGKVWNLAYRFNGKQKKLHIGPYPEISLQDARERARAARRLLADAIDPADEKQRQKANKAKVEANTFSVVAEELLEKKRLEGKASATMVKRAWIFRTVAGDIGARPITDITPGDILAVLRKVETKGQLEKARRMRAAIGEVFRFAIATDRAVTDPTFSLCGAIATPQVTHRAAITNPKDFGALLRAIEGFNGQPTTIAALKLMALMFPRPGELRMAEWSEFALKEAVWTIPAARTKMRRAHQVPLAKQSLVILQELYAITGRSKLVFPGYGKGSVSGKPVTPRPISENTLNGALRRMGYTMEDATAHGFRATASTLLNESGKWHPDAIERALAHAEPNKVRRAYARGEHWLERVQMMQWWADHLDALRDGAKIIPISGRTA